MTVKDQMDMLIIKAKKYRKSAARSISRNSYMNDIDKDFEVPQKIIDAVVVDFLNSVAADSGMDLGLYVSDLH